MKQWIWGVLLMGLTACGGDKALSAEPPISGNDRDANGCIGSAGYQWSQLKKECVQVFNVAEVSLTDPSNPTLAVYAIISDDRSQAELFMASLEQSALMDSVKGGYRSLDGKYFLQTDGQGNWRLRQN